MTNNNNNLKMMFVAALFAQNGLIADSTARDFNKEMESLNALKEEIKEDNFGLMTKGTFSADANYLVYNLSGVSCFGGLNAGTGRDAVNIFSYGAHLIATVIVPSSLLKEEGILSRFYAVLSVYAGGMKNSIAINFSDYINAGGMIGAGFNFFDCVGIELAGGYEKLFGVVFKVSLVYTYENKVRGRVNFGTSLKSLKTLTKIGKENAVKNAKSDCDVAIKKLEELKKKAESNSESSTAEKPEAKSNPVSSTAEKPEAKSNPVSSTAEKPGK